MKCYYCYPIQKYIESLSLASLIYLVLDLVLEIRYRYTTTSVTKRVPPHLSHLNGCFTSNFIPIVTKSPTLSQLNDFFTYYFIPSVTKEYPLLCHTEMTLLATGSHLVSEVSNKWFIFQKINLADRARCLDNWSNGRTLFSISLKFAPSGFRR